MLSKILNRWHTELLFLYPVETLCMKILFSDKKKKNKKIVISMLSAEQA